MRGSSWFKTLIILISDIKKKGDRMRMFCKITFQKLSTHIQRDVLSLRVMEVIEMKLQIHFKYVLIYEQGEEGRGIEAILGKGCSLFFPLLDVKV